MKKIYISLDDCGFGELDGWLATNFNVLRVSLVPFDRFGAQPVDRAGAYILYQKMSCPEKTGTDYQ
ncbi:hypothetical protein HU762_12120 [Pseudomonas sp. SWRI92]|uniref:hypothetical protein n=1 Tax=Pseudomonas sp. SWRI92 TaxID=2745499 RepID=UPI0016482009|nr:hypothetical protein [Pseudomonas sp. SWRI92]MBC3374687.1 hypothetical protein [Pseudomonas sp. SWRI92]